VLYGPGKAANAGGVATSGSRWRRTASASRGRARSRRAPAPHHGRHPRNCFETAQRFGTPGNLVNGANIAGFLKVADAMLDQGWV
jgi:glutamate dehydrogenase (NADP+)